MYGLFTKMGAGAVLSAGLSVLGVTFLCTDQPNRPHHRPAALVAVDADAALGAGVVTAPSSHGPGNGNPGHGYPGNGNPGSSNPGSSNSGNGNPGTSNPGTNTNPGNSNPGNTNPGNSNPGTNHPAPDCGCGANNPSLVNVKPDVDVDVDVVVKLPDPVVAPDLVGGVVGTVGTVVGVVLPDCGCTPVGDLPAALPLPLLGH